MPGRAFLLVVLVVSALAATSCTGAAAPAPSSATGTVWLCRPGMARDPCTYDSRATAVGPGGGQSPATLSDVQSPATAHRFDCFYVYPTASEEPGANADLTIQQSEIDIAAAQVSQFSNVCDVWAPMYRQSTVSEIERGLADSANGLSSLQPSFAVAYDSLLSAWTDFLAHDAGGRPIILIGHSQGSAILIHLIAQQIDANPSLRRRLVLAILPGGNVLVPTGKVVGGDFAHVPLCSAPAQFGCVIAYSTFPSQPPADALFGRAGQGANSIRPSPAGARADQVACVNPASLAGGTGVLTPFFPTVGTAASAVVSTPWVTYPKLYTAACTTAAGASWLQVTDVAGPGDTRPVVTETQGPQWGLHLYDVNLALGNLVRDVATAENAWSAANPAP